MLRFPPAFAPRAFPLPFRAALDAAGWLVPVLLAVLIAFGVGTASARAVLGEREGFARDGAWSVAPSSGGADVDPYSRARLARTGAVPLGLAEGLALSTRTDRAGRPLTGACRYRLDGPLPPARHWSVWVEPRSDDPARPSALGERDVVRGRDGGFAIALSRGVRPGNWLAVPEGPFTLRLALYDTTATRTGGASTLATSVPTRVSCAPGTEPGPAGAEPDPEAAS